MDLHLFSLNILYGFVIWFMVFFVIPILIIKKKNTQTINLYLLLYLLLLLLGVLLDIEIYNNNINFSLLIDNQWCSGLITLGYFHPITIILNIFLLFPLGFIYPIKHNPHKNIYIKILFLAFVISLTIESLQFILPINRTFEILDIINNTLSALLGYFYYIIISRIFRGDAYDQLPK